MIGSNKFIQWMTSTVSDEKISPKISQIDNYTVSLFSDI